MPYQDDDDLFGEDDEFEFVDDDDEGADLEAKSDEDAAPDKASPKRSPRRGKAEEKPPSRGRASGGKREPARRAPPPPDPVSDAVDSAPDDLPPDDDSDLGEVVAADPNGPPSDHVVHIYEHGAFQRTIPRKFTDEEAVGFAEEYTRTGKPYGRYAVATPDDEEPSPTFQGASRD